MEWNVKDVVCGMEVGQHEHETHYLQMQFAFCSEQCRDRFLANPHLYIGRPGKPAPKHQGKEAVKRRRLRLYTHLSADQATRLVTSLQEMMGVRDVKIEEDRLDITYDLLEATAEQIEARIVGVGAALGKAWYERLHRAFVHYEEECEAGNLEVGEKHTHG